MSHPIISSASPNVPLSILENHHSETKYKGPLYGSELITECKTVCQTLRSKNGTGINAMPIHLTDYWLLGAVHPETQTQAHCA